MITSRHAKSACRGAGVAVGGQDREVGGREEYPPPPSRGGDDLPGPPSRPPPGERESAEDRAARRKRQDIIGVSFVHESDMAPDGAKPQKLAWPKWLCKIGSCAHMPLHSSQLPCVIMHSLLCKIVTPIM